MNTERRPTIRQSDLSVDRLLVHSIFRTIQGEGPFTGAPSVFVRLAECNISCFWCDTEYQGGERFEAGSTLLDHLEETVLQKGDLIVLTGGEPMAQAIGNFMQFARERGYTVQIESNGTLNNEGAFEQITQQGLGPGSPEQSRAFSRNGNCMVVSPKTGKLADGIIQHTIALKYVVAAGQLSLEDGLPMMSTQVVGAPQRLARPPKGWNPRAVYISPMDEYDEAKNKLNREAAIKVCMEFGYTLNLQVHKILGME